MCETDYLFDPTLLSALFVGYGNRAASQQSGVCDIWHFTAFTPRIYFLNHSKTSVFTCILERLSFTTTLTSRLCGSFKTVRTTARITQRTRRLQREGADILVQNVVQPYDFCPFIQKKFVTRGDHPSRYLPGCMVRALRPFSLLLASLWFVSVLMGFILSKNIIMGEYYPEPHPSHSTWRYFFHHYVCAGLLCCSVSLRRWTLSLLPPGLK